MFCHYGLLNVDAWVPLDILDTLVPFGIWYTLSHMDTVGHFGHTFGLIGQSSLNLIIEGSRHDRVYLIKS